MQIDQDTVKKIEEQFIRFNVFKTDLADDGNQSVNPRNEQAGDQEEE